MLKKSLLLGLVVVMIMSHGAGWATAATPTPALNAGDIEQFLDTVIQQQMDEFNIPNLTVSVVAGGEIIMTKGYGHADLATGLPVDPTTTLFRIGSTAKLFTWTAVMQLVEQGKLDLDTDINEYLDFAIPSRLAFSRETAPPITLKHLMTHTPGFEDNMSSVFSLTPVSTLDQYVRDRLPERVFPPGEVIAYSNYGTALAGYIVQQVSGVPYAQYIEENIYRPLGMANSSFRQPLPEHLRDKMATAYRYVDGAFREGQFEYMTEPSGSMSSTAMDMARFMLAFLNGGQLDGNTLLREETTRTMFEPLFSPHAHIDGMAHGLIEGTFNQRRTLIHPGGTMLFNTGLYLLPKEGVGLFISHSGGSYLANIEVFHAFMERYFPGPTPSTPLPPTGMAERSRALAGEYHQNRKAYTTEDRFLSLMMGQIHVRTDAEGYLLVTHLGETHRFVEVEPGVYQSLREGRSQDYGSDFRTIAFTTDPLGRTMLLSGGPMSYSRAPWYETGRFVFPLIIVSLLFVIATQVVWGVRAIIRKLRRKASAAVVGSSASLLARRVAVLYGVLAVLFLVGFAMGGAMDPVYGLPASAYTEPSTLTKVLDVVPLLMAITGVALVLFSVLAWIKSYWRLTGRVHYTLMAAASTALLWVFVYWSVI